jgi:hypothetical protein
MEHCVDDLLFISYIYGSLDETVLERWREGIDKECGMRNMCVTIYDHLDILIADFGHEGYLVSHFVKRTKIILL